MDQQLADRTPTFKGGLARMMRSLRAALFPPVCLGCRALVSTNGTLCTACWRRLRFIDEPCCAVLGIPFAHDMGDGAVSPQAIAEPPVFAAARAAVAHEGLARRLVHDLKYRDRTDLAPWLGAWMARAGRDFRPATDLVVPVPLHRRRFFTRRFNQSAELARSVAAAWDAPCEPAALRRVRRTRQQVGLKASQRADNVRGAFLVPEEFRPMVKGKSILLVDDVFTTGATVTAATRALMKAGAVGVNVLTFARVVPGDRPPDEAEDFHDA